jgi:hypothetical protein
MKALIWLISLIISTAVSAKQADLDKKIWAHQAIMATFQVNAKTYIADQKEIAQYFSSVAWKRYLQVLEKVKLQQYIEKNNFRISAVAIKPVTLKQFAPGKWQASMPVLAQYKNPQFSQLQTVEATIQFVPAPSGQGIQGYQLISFVSKNLDKPCRCMTEKGKANLTIDNS